MGGRGGGGSGVSNANAGVPASKRKVVQSLKEIVNCSESEIYAMLVECDMDPDEAVSRLLSQDTFHEVKSKREKKKETKDPAESWTRNIPNRGGRSFNDSYNTSRGGGGNKYNSNETGSGQGVTPNRRENGARNHWSGSSLSAGVLGRQPSSNSVPASSEVKKAPIEASQSETVTSSSLPPTPAPAYQSAWVNANPGQRTLADIVKMGTPNQQKNVVLPRSSEAQESGSKAPLKDEWPSIEKQDVSYPLANAWKPSPESKTEQFSESQHLDDHHHHQAEVESPPDADHISPASVSSRNLLDDDDSRESSVCEDDDDNNKPERHSYEENVDEDVSTGFQQLTIDNEEEQEALQKEDKPVVIIPNHLQIHSSECSHLMFGSFGGSGQASSGLNDNLDEPLEPEDDSSFRHPETNFYGEEEEEEQLRNATTTTTNDQASYQIDSSVRNYQSATDSETEAVQHEPPQEGHQYKFSSSADYGFENSQQMNPPSETNPQMQNLDTFPNVMQQGYTSSLPNTLLQSGIQDPRESDLHYSPFQTKYNTATPSSLTGPSISMAEALRAANMSPQNAVPNAGQQAAALAQHIALNPYTHQPGMALGPYGNLISYPFMPQSYNPYLASGFQQFPAGNHQSLPGMLPQYKTQATAPSAPMPPSAYGFGGGAASSNNFALNPTSAANSYEDVLNSQFKDSNHLAASLQQQQNENSAAWHQGQQQNSRVVPGSGYYSFPGLQNQQPPGFRQAQQLQQQQQQQQPSQQQQQQQHFGGHGYVSPYHSQAGMSLEQLHHQHQQQQNARDASKQNQQQLWPNNY